MSLLKIWVLYWLQTAHSINFEIKAKLLIGLKFLNCYPLYARIIVWHQISFSKTVSDGVLYCQLLLFSPQSALTHWGRDKIDAISQTTFSSAFSCKIILNSDQMLVPKGPINNIPTWVQIMAWRRPGEKPLSDPMMASLPTHICGTRPQWINEMNIMSISNF